MSSRHPTEQNFLKDVAEHELQVVQELGLHRHLKFKKPGTYHMHFHIVTWPGYLAFSGDMGCFVFSRLPDMFEFFRGRSKEELEINLGYWSEKIEATNKHRGHKEFSPELFEENIKRWLTEREATKATIDEVTEEVLSATHDGEYPAMQAAMQFKSADGFRFTDFWEVDCREYTFHFVWCCYAIAWAIRKYDAAK